MNSSEEFPIEKLCKLLGTGGVTKSSMAWLSTEGGIPTDQTELAPEGLEWSEDVYHAKWIKESLSNFEILRSIPPRGFPSYTRIFHPAYLGEER